MYDAIVIGGGFYGTSIAIDLAKNRRFSKIALIEKESSLLNRASRNNQARVHKGYHYPRSYITGFRSNSNFPRFLCDYRSCLAPGLTTLYAIARKNSKITAKQFQRFCEAIGATIKPAPRPLEKLFAPNFIEQVFLVEESVFDVDKLRSKLELELLNNKIEIILKTSVKRIYHSKPGILELAAEDELLETRLLSTQFVFNCTYSGLNQFQGDFTETKSLLKHEITEMALIEMPVELQQLGITVMDGPFFSLMPFPSENLHTLSHVRYTPHHSWNDRANKDPYHEIANYHCQTRADRMLKDANRYLPTLVQAKYIKSIFEVKTILQKNEFNDGRPILFEKNATLPGCYSILGGKIDNIYDVLEKLNAEPF